MNRNTTRQEAFSCKPAFLRVNSNPLQRRITMKRPITACFILAVAGSTSAATINGTVIDSASISSGTLQSITVGSTTYSTLISPTSLVDNTTGSDWIHTDSSAPSDITAAIGSLDLTEGALNQAFEAQFSGLTDTSLFFLIVNNNDISPNADMTIYALDAAGNRLGSTSGVLDLRPNGTVPTLVSATTYNRTTDGSANGSLDRILSGVVFSLTDLGLDGLGATGLEFDELTSSANVDPQAFGLALVPEPGSLALLGLGGLCMLKRRRRA